MWGEDLLWSAFGLLVVLLAAGAVWASRRSDRDGPPAHQPDPTGPGRAEPTAPPARAVATDPVTGSSRSG